VGTGVSVGRGVSVGVGRGGSVGGGVGEGSDGLHATRTSRTKTVINTVVSLCFFIGVSFSLGQSAGIIHDLGNLPIVFGIRIEVLISSLF
jgi:hypothetical protein